MRFKKPLVMFLRVNTTRKQKQHCKTRTTHGNLLTIEGCPTIPRINFNLRVSNSGRGDGLHTRNKRTIGWRYRLELLLIPASHTDKRDFEQLALELFTLVRLTRHTVCVGDAFHGV